MHKTRRSAALVAALGGCLLASPQALAICGGGVTAFGLENCPLGGATLTKVGGDLEVSNIGGTGLDGVEVRLPSDPATRCFLLALNDQDPYDANTNGAFLDLSATGTNGSVSDIGSVRLTREEVFIDSIEYEVKVEPDFSPIGVGTYSLTITSNGAVVAQLSGQTGPVRVRNFNTRSPSRDQTPPVLRTSRTAVNVTPLSAARAAPVDVAWTLIWLEPLLIRPSGGTAVAGDSMVITGNSASVSIGRLTTVSLRAKDTLDITITNEWASPSPQCIVPVAPTVAEWGLVTLTLLLLTGGTIVFGRRRQAPAVG